MKKLTVIAVHPIHYNDFLFHQINKAGLKIKVYYDNPVLSNYPWKDRLNYSFEHDNCKPVGKIDWRLVKKIATKRDNIFMVCGWDSFNKNALLFFLRLFGRRYFIFTDTYKAHIKRSPLKASLRESWLKFIFGGCYKILTTGEIGVSKLRAFYDHDKVVNFPFATDISYFNSAPDFSGFADEKIIFSSGRLLNSHKGYDVAIKALAEVKKKGYKFKYLIAGTGPDEKMLKQLVDDLDLNNEVVFLGWQELTTLISYYGKAHIFLHASHFDPFPNSILEAMASGLIVVASDVAGSAVERINNDENGFIFRDNSVEDLANNILKVFALPQNRLQGISAEARKTSEKWNVDYNIDIIKNIVNAD